VTQQQTSNVRGYLRLHQPLLSQPWHWCAKLLLGDLGPSRLLGQPVIEATRLRLPVTLALFANGRPIALAISQPVASSRCLQIFAASHGSATLKGTGRSNPLVVRGMARFPSLVEEV